MAKMTKDERYKYAALFAGKMCDITYALGYQIKVLSVDDEERVAFVKASKKKPNLPRVAELSAEIAFTSSTLKQRIM